MSQASWPRHWFGTGKTAARGHKGQKSRSGVSLGFEGGQMPLYRRLPKGGFTNVFRKNYRVVNIGRIQSAIDAGKLDAGKVVTEHVLVEGGHYQIQERWCKVLGNGELKAKIEVVVSGSLQRRGRSYREAGGKITMTQLIQKTVLRKTDAANAKEPAAEKDDDDDRQGMIYGVCRRTACFADQLF